MKAPHIGIIIVVSLSQQVLADKAGLSRSTITKVEGKRQTLTWSTFLALFLIFKENPETAKLLKAFEIDTNDINAVLSGNKLCGGTQMVPVIDMHCDTAELIYSKGVYR